MGIFDDLGKAATDLWNAGKDFVEGLAEDAEEALEVAGEFFVDEILGLDDLTSGESSGGGSEGHEEEHEWGNSSSGLQAANLTDALVTSVKDAQSKPDAMHGFWMADIQGTVDDIVTEPDSTHVFDKVAGTVDEIVTTIGTEPGVAKELPEANTKADTLQFIPQMTGPAHTPEWTNFNDGDPGPAILQIPPYVATDGMFGSTLGEPTSVFVPQMPPADLTFATTLDDASQTPSISWLF
jgi:hypothetical protein